MKKPLLSVGDKVIVIDPVSLSYGETRIIEVVEDGIAYSDYERQIGYYASTGAGRLAKKDGKPFVRKLTKLERVLK